MTAGTAVGTRDDIVASRLAALDKGNNKVRLIAIGELFYRVCAQKLMRVAQCPTDVLPIQLGA